MLRNPLLHVPRPDSPQAAALLLSAIFRTSLLLTSISFDCSTRTPTLRGLVCEYGSVFDQGVGPDHSIAEQIDLTATPAGRLASAVAQLDVGAPQGSASCPNDTGEVIVIVFDFSDSRPVDLWWHSTGCQSIDNGATEAAQVANDSFGHFQAVFEAVTRRQLKQPSSARVRATAVSITSF